MTALCTLSLLATPRTTSLHYKDQDCEMVVQSHCDTVTTNLSHILLAKINVCSSIKFNLTSNRKRPEG